MLTDPRADRPAGTRRVIGIDPGTRALGWGVVEQCGTVRRCVAFGVIRPPDESLADRLCYIDAELEALIREHAPDTAAVESIFFAKDPQSAAKLGHARGVVLLRLRRAGMMPMEIAPALVKRAVVGRGRADKNQVARVIAAAFAMPEPPPSDAADALAVALTCLATAGYADALERAGVSRAGATPPRRR